jgi:hypothetical protein
METKLSDHQVNLLLVVGNAARRIEREECAKLAEKSQSPQEAAKAIRDRRDGD